MENELITRKKAAEILMVDPLTVRNYERQGKVKPNCYVGKFPRYLKSDVEKMLTPKKQ